MISFSVIIPCYNASRTIVRALDSIVNQDYGDYEIICIDDCSQDNTVDVIKSYKNQHDDKRIILLQNDKNSGPGVTRNHGLKIARGLFLCFLDADDFYGGLFFKELEYKIEKENADVVFYGCNQLIGKTTRRRPVVPRESVPDYMALVGGSFGGGAWRRTLWEGIKIPAISNAEDIAVIPVLLSRSKTIAVSDKFLYNYIHSNSSISSRHNPRVSYNFVESFHYTLQHIDVDKYHDSVEFHGIKTIIYGATLNGIKAHMPKQDIFNLWSEFELFFPNWPNNKYLNTYSFIKRLFILMASKRRFGAMCLYAKAHNLLLKIIG